MVSRANREVAIGERSRYFLLVVLIVALVVGGRDCACNPVILVEHHRRILVVGRCVAAVVLRKDAIQIATLRCVLLVQSMEV